jgi:hypothetical protein
VERARTVLGIKTIPKQFMPVLADERIGQVFADARRELSETPSPYEVVEVSSGGGIQPQDVPFESRLKDLSESEKQSGMNHIETVYKMIDEMLTQMEKQIADNERTPMHVILVLIAAGLVLGALAILGLGFFQHSQIALTGKDGAATLMLATGVSVGYRVYGTDRKFRTLPARIRIRFAACLAREDYAEIRACFTDAVDKLDGAFVDIRRDK